MCSSDLGAAAALTLAAAAAIARWDVAKMAALPHVPAEILLPRTHRTGYAHALAASGARLVDIGHNDRGTGAVARAAAEAITIDHASNGRLELSYGAAWFDKEHTELGIPFPALKQRIDAFEPSREPRRRRCGIHVGAAEISCIDRV